MNFRTTLILGAALTCVTTSLFAADAMLADRHVVKGISCQMCHGPDKDNLQEPTTETCKQCHNVKSLVERTSKVKPTNPHVSPHYASDLDCSSCHMGHLPGENFCNQCHTFDFKVK